MESKEIKMLILYSDSNLRRKVCDLFQKDKIKFIFSENKEISEVERHLIEECDIYCMAKKFIDGGQSIAYCTIMLENKDDCTEKFKI